MQQPVNFEAAANAVATKQIRSDSDSPSGTPISNVASAITSAGTPEKMLEAEHSEPDQVSKFAIPQPQLARRKSDNMVTLEKK